MVDLYINILYNMQNSLEGLVSVRSPQKNIKSYSLYIQHSPTLHTCMHGHMTYIQRSGLDHTAGIAHASCCDE